MMIIGSSEAPEGLTPMQVCKKLNRHGVFLYIFLGVIIFKLSVICDLLQGQNWALSEISHQTGLTYQALSRIARG